MQPERKSNFNRHDGSYNSMPRSKSKLGSVANGGPSSRFKQSMSSNLSESSSSLTRAQANNRLLALQKRMGLSTRETNGLSTAQQQLGVNARTKPRVVASIPKQNSSNGLSVTNGNTISNGIAINMANSRHIDSNGHSVTKRSAQNANNGHITTNGHTFANGSGHNASISHPVSRSSSVGTEIW